jgi:predicted nucleic acid-binding protein
LLSFSTIVEATHEAETLMKDKEFEVNSTQVLKLVSESNCSSYDCEFVALAEDLGVKLATFDKKIRREFSDVALHPRDFFSE